MEHLQSWDATLNKMDLIKLGFFFSILNTLNYPNLVAFISFECIVCTFVFASIMIQRGWRFQDLKREGTYILPFFFHH